MSTFGELFAPDTLAESGFCCKGQTPHGEGKGRIGTAPAGPRTVPVRSAWPGAKSLAFCSPPQRADMLRTGTVRGPGAVSRCARRLPRCLSKLLPEPNFLP